MKRKIQNYFSVLLVVLCLLTGCTSSENVYQYADFLAEQLISAVEAGDTDTIISLCAPYIQEQNDIQKEAEALLYYINGRIISYDTPEGKPGEKRVSDGVTEYYLIHGTISNIKTDKDKCYDITFTSYWKNQDHPDHIGIFDIQIRKNTDIIFELGELPKLN